MRTVGSLALAGALALGLAACGDDDDDTATTDAAATEAPGSTEAPAATEAPGSTTAATTPAGSSAGEGFVYTSSDGSYSVTYPTEPVEQSQEQQLPDGSTLPVTFVLHAEPTKAFISSVVEYPPEVTADLQGAADGAIANSGATLTDEQDIELDGRQGRQLVADVQGQGTLIARIYVDGNRLWQVIYTGQGTVAPDDPEASAFLDSFQFTEGG